MQNTVGKEVLLKIAKEYHLNSVVKDTSFKNLSLLTKEFSSLSMSKRCDDYDQPGPSGRCIDFVCQRLGTCDCDSLSEIDAVAKTCKGLKNPI